ncbi:MAG: 16S rRNA (cytosine(1402)-N(4))-methyltransferase, partial [Chloroflexi bacterium]|nr:16S rRNA (cytosine(1402)-N(4))-methyltransferase [Chloroflexota bacterium]
MSAQHSQKTALAERPEHKAVLYEEVIHWLRPQPGGRYIDATVGLGGHAKGILEASTPGGLLL